MARGSEAYFNHFESSVEEPTRPRKGTSTAKHTPSPNVHYTFPDYPTGPTKTVVFDQENCTATAEVESTRPIMTTFELELRRLINSQSMENSSNTPDFILAEYLNACLAAYNVATRARERWYGRRTF
jgi:hypothetical protein